MKKFIIVMFAFVLLFLGFNANIAQATDGTVSAATAAGCTPGANFSTTTGQPCRETSGTACAPGEKFSSENGLPCPSSGITNPPKTTNTGFSIEMQRGARGAEVKRLQQFLKEQGYFTGKADGVVGPATLKLLNR